MVGGKSWFVLIGTVLVFFAPYALCQNVAPSIDPTFNLKSIPPPQTYPIEASWIWCPKDNGSEKFVEFRKKIDISDPSQNTFIFITAYKSFRLKVNEVYVGSSHFSLQEGWKQTHSYNIKNYLKSGSNLISIGVRSSKDDGGLLARIDGKDNLIAWTDKTWEVKHNGKWIFANELGRATITLFPSDSDRTLDGWPDYFPETPEYLRHLNISPTEVLEVHGHITGANTVGTQKTLVTVDSSHSSSKDFPYLILDFGKELSGRLVLKSDQTSVAIVTPGESLEEAKESPYRTYKLVTTKKGTSSTDNTAFRFVKILFPKVKGLASKRNYLEVYADHDFYPVEYKGSFDCSDSLLTKIWYTGAYTTHLCMKTEIWDAPKRDRMAWMGDLHVSGEVVNIAFGDTFLMEKTLTNLRKDAQGSRGSLELPEKHVNLIPGYSCAWISTLADFHRHSGDLEFLIGQKENLKTLLKYLEQDLDSNNIFANKNKGTNFVDWSPGLSKDSPETRRGTHFFLTKAFREAGFLFDELGDHFSAKNYWNFADELAVAGRGYFFEPDAKTFGLRRQVNAMAILSGTSLDSDGESIFEKILKPLSPAWADMATPYYNYYVLEAMAQLGHYESALSVIRTYWGEMLDLGATSFWEAYDSSWPKTNFHRHLKADDGEGTFVSLNHGWSAGPTVWLTENVLGIKPKSGGFSLTEISPHLEDLEWASGSVPTPHGLIEIKIAKNPGGLKMNLSLPSGIRAHIKLPGSQIWVNGEPVVGQKMGGEILFELANSGTYEISSSQ